MKKKRLNVTILKKSDRKMINFDNAIKGNVKEHNPPNSPQISDYPYRILLIGGSVSGKANSLFNLINHQTDFDKIPLKQNIIF